MRHAGSNSCSSSDACVKELGSWAQASACYEAVQVTWGPCSSVFPLLDPDQSAASLRSFTGLVAMPCPLTAHVAATLATRGAGAEV